MNSAAMPNARQSKILNDAMHGDVTVDEFKDFFCTKAFDVLSENRYRKFLVQAR